MKKVIGIILALSTLACALALTGCKGQGSMKFGMGIYTENTKNTDAEADSNGIGEATVTVAAILLDEKGRIADCFVDSVSPRVEYTAEGKVVSGGEIKSKYQLKDNYKMAASGFDVNSDGVVKEWYEQAEIFANTVKGKTLDEVKMLVGTENRGNEELQKAGCTITVSEFVMALERAEAKTTDCQADKNTKLMVNTSAKRDDNDAKDGVKGVVEVNIDFIASAKDGSNAEPFGQEKAELKFEFDQNGKAVK